MTDSHCPLCGRCVPLTAHHLIPRKVHRRAHFKKHYSKAELQQTLMICRQCHSGLHKLFDEMYLAKHLYSLEKLLENPEIQKHCEWVAKLRVAKE